MRGRKPIPVVKETFQDIVSLLETTNTFGNRSALWSAVADTEWAKGIGLSAQVAMLKAKTLGLVIKTPLGQKGRQKGCGPVKNVGKRSRKTMALPVIESLKKEYPSMHTKIDRAAAGSLKAAIGMKCLDCSNGGKKEVSLCPIETCPLWHVRPYQGKYKEVSS
jgi:hypothetical protein